MAIQQRTLGLWASRDDGDRLCEALARSVLPSAQQQCRFAGQCAARAAPGRRATFAVNTLSAIISSRMRGFCAARHPYPGV